jgi:hypothetical protein
MSRTLRPDIYSLRTAGISIDQVKPPDPDPLAAVRYSCLYWVDHLVDSNTKGNNRALEDGGSVENFLFQSYLYWLEALSLIGSLSNGIVTIRKLENWLEVSFYPLLNIIRRSRLIEEGREMSASVRVRPRRKEVCLTKCIND